MNYQLAVVGGLTVLALFAHVFGGIRQSLSIEPVKLADNEKLANFETLDRNWVQSMCAFQLVTVDLLALSALLFLIAFTDVFVQKQLMGFALAAFFFFMGLRVACAAFYAKAKSNGLPATRSLEFLVWVFCSHLLGRFISMSGSLLPCSTNRHNPSCNRTRQTAPRRLTLR